MTGRSDLVSIVEKLTEARVLCIGDVMLDHFVTGEVERISPEAPVPVLRVTDEKAMLGGAGNVVRNLVSLGVQARFVTVIGDDEAGQEVARLVGDLGISESPIIDGGRRTSNKTRYIAGVQQLLRADWETPVSLRPEIEQRVMEMANEALSQCHALVLSDYGKGVLTDTTVAKLIETASAAGKPVIVDPKGSDYSRYGGADLITPNRRELAEASAMPVSTDDDITAAAGAIIERHGISAVLATRSGDGMTLISRDGTSQHLPAEAREVFDVSGAGDTVAAVMAAALGTGVSGEDAVALANVAAGVVVGKVGTAPAYSGEIIAALHHQDISTAEAKVLTRTEVLERVEAWRRQGLKAGFTNGAFDLLHPGHVSLLAQAGATCDRLIVGLNSDASVKRLKGDDRPVQTEAARATVLASLASVDVVVIFGEDTPLELIEALRPDVLVKGADYAMTDVVGADVVRGYGGQVVLAELEPDQSTSETIARINRESA